MCTSGFVFITEACGAVGGTITPSPVCQAMDMFGLFSTSGCLLGTLQVCPKSL